MVLPGSCQRKKNQVNSPTNNAVKSTPILERIPPHPTTPFTEDHFVSNPPENRMNAIAMLPMMFAMRGSSKGICPIPSDPASMPTPRNTTRTGMLIHEDNLLAHAQARIKTARTVRP